jgi:hypothetical protein
MRRLALGLLVCILTACVDRQWGWIPAIATVQELQYDQELGQRPLGVGGWALELASRTLASPASWLCVGTCGLGQARRLLGLPPRLLEVDLGLQALAQVRKRRGSISYLRTL